MQLPQKQLLGRAEVVAYVKQQQPRLLLTVGAGDIDQLIESLKQALEHVA